jgi:uncharacterized protein (DUF1778 family)
MQRGLSEKPPRRRDIVINLRASAEVRDLIDRAAAMVGKSRSDFMLDCARARAEEILLDQTSFVLSEAQFAELTRILDAPAEPSRKLRDLLASTPPWEK